jgi:hypothetical protein
VRVAVGFRSSVVRTSQLPLEELDVVEAMEEERSKRR